MLITHPTHSASSSTEPSPSLISPRPLPGQRPQAWAPGPPHNHHGFSCVSFLEFTQPQAYPERGPGARQHCYLVRMARWSSRCQFLHDNPFGSTPSSCQDVSSLAGWQQLFQWDGTVHLPASKKPRSYKQVRAPPPGHSLSPASSPLPQVVAGPTSTSRNLWQGSRNHRWSTPSSCRVSGLPVQQSG